MSKIESLVPPLELCKLIPAGEFEDAAFAWINAEVVGFVCRTSGCEQVAGKEWQLIRSNASRVIRSRKRGEEIYPAPTLDELIADLADMSTYAIKICESFNEWHVACCVATEYGERDVSADSCLNASTAALKLWLKLKGIEA